MPEKAKERLSHLNPWTYFTYQCIFSLLWRFILKNVKTLSAEKCGRKQKSAYNTWNTNLLNLFWNTRYLCYVYKNMWKYIKIYKKYEIYENIM